MPVTIFPGINVNIAAGQLVSVVLATSVLNQAGNVTNNLTAGQIWRLKSSVVTTDATVINRIQQVRNANIASKTATATQTRIDLLDREVVFTAVGTNFDVSLSGGVAGDTNVLTLERLF